jgi:UDP-N-acetyl-D-mannosaminuronic acid transferase (WecB/TagA/CpsF family)
MSFHNNKLSEDENIINVHMDNMRMKEKIKDMEIVINKCDDDYWFIINSIENYSTNKEECLKDILERIKFRKPMFKRVLESYISENSIK